MKTGTLFDDVAKSPEEAIVLAFRSDLLNTLRLLFQERGLNAAQIGEALDIPASRVSELLHGKIHLFAADRLLVYLARMGWRLEVQYEDGNVWADGVGVEE